jgi:hypothetical protein
LIRCAPGGRVPRSRCTRLRRSLGWHAQICPQYALHGTELHAEIPPYPCFGGLSSARRIWWSRRLSYAAFPHAFSLVAVAQGVAHVPMPGAADDVSLTAALREQGVIAYGRSSVIWDRYCLAYGVGSLFIHATEPDAVASGQTFDNRHGSYYSSGPSIGMRPRETRRTEPLARWLRQWLTIGRMIS